MPLRSAASVSIPFGAFLGGPPTDLQIIEIKQEQTEWCWDACMQMMLRHAGDTTIQQCDLADAAFDCQGCCSSPKSSLCNKALQVAQMTEQWNRVGYSAAFSPGAIAFANIQLNIDSGAAIQVGIKWQQGGGHAILITGYGDNNTVLINDPFWGAGPHDYDSVVSAYQTKGTWTWTWTGLQKM